MLSNLLLDHVTSAMGDSCGPGAIENLRPVHQTIAHTAYQFRFRNRLFLLKVAEPQYARTVSSEYMGLKYLQDSRCVRTPEIIVYFAGNSEISVYLVVAWIDRGMSTAEGQKQLGEKLAALHDASAEIFGIRQFGFIGDNYIGNNPQFNDWHDEWPAFFVNQRLKPQIQMGMKNGFIDQRFRDQLSLLCERIPHLLADQPFSPCLLHGDLWGGNVLFNLENKPVLIDPAVYFGIPEAELAFTEMFGGFTREFYQAYNAVLPIPHGYEDRKKLYNLYHVLNHMNLFGQMYMHEAKAICAHYIGC